MQIKKFTAPTLKEASLLMKEELGSEALILGTRVIYGDAVSSTGRNFEITAGIENNFSSQTITRPLRSNVSSTHVASL